MGQLVTHVPSDNKSPLTQIVQRVDDEHFEHPAEHCRHPFPY